MFSNYDPRVIPAAVTLWGEQVRESNRKLIEKSYGLWRKSWLSSEFRAFMFNLGQGKLYLNKILHRIRPEENRKSCTYLPSALYREGKIQG